MIRAIENWLSGDEDPKALAAMDDLDSLTSAARALRDQGHGHVVSYSRKVFIPLTKLCRDVCHYCTFAHPPKRGERAFLTIDEVVDLARAGANAGCREALFTLGDKPEVRYRVAREELAALGHATTISYLAEAAAAVIRETGLLPHLNPGVLSEEDIVSLRPHAVSMGLMLESISPRLCQPGQPHHGSPDKNPALRLATLEAAGRHHVPMTTGLLIGIGETRQERVDGLIAIRDLDRRYGHVQEVIVQNFLPKPGTRMANASATAEIELLWTIAVARLILGPGANIQAPPNLNSGRLGNLVAAGINDWGGVSPVTPDHVNPECAWPHLDSLAAETARSGKVLVERLALYPSYALHVDTWVDAGLGKQVRDGIDSHGYARVDGWRTGLSDCAPASTSAPAVIGTGADLDAILDRAERGSTLDEAEVERLFSARGTEVDEICSAANDLRRRTVGDDITYVINRNINYTNICKYRCQFCAFSKGKTHEALRGKPYLLDLDEISRRTAEAWERGATEVCLQGGIHPEFSARTYIDICRAVKRGAADIHIHAFSALEIAHGAKSSGLSVDEMLGRLIDEGLGSLPGTAAEILVDDVRQVICPDKVDTATWLEVIETAHRLGLPTTSTIMFGHVERPVHWARHLLELRRLQDRTGGITEFVPLPFVAAEAPMYRRGLARPGPTYRECLLMHAVARLALHPCVPNIQTSWVKMGPQGALDCLRSGANDFGGVLMNESISRAAGASHGQELSAGRMQELARSIGRTPRQRTTLYGPVPRVGVAGNSSADPSMCVRKHDSVGGASSSAMLGDAVR